MGRCTRMRYLWQEYSKDKVYTVDDCPLSPYWEFSYSNGREIGINPMLRFYDIFSPLWEKQIFNENDRKTLENCLFHFLAGLDCHCGLHRTSLQEILLETELLEGRYGKEAKHMYESLTEDERSRLRPLMRRHAEADGRKSFFRPAVLTFFPQARLYYYCTEKKLLIYLPQAQTEKAAMLMELLQQLFFDITGHLEIFWGKHFGILGRAETMQLDHLVIY